jgi:hypothetical protein
MLALDLSPEKAARAAVFLCQLRHAVEEQRRLDGAIERCLDRILPRLVREELETGNGQ